MIEWIVTSCILIAVIIALRCILKGKISLRLQYALWALALLRLLIPFSIGSSALSVVNLTAAVGEQPAVQAVLNLGQADLPAQSFDSAEVSKPEGSELEATDDGAYSLTEGPGAAGLLKSIALYVWFAGIAVVGLFFMISNLRFAARVNQSRHVIEAADGKLPVYVTNAIDTPCLFGPFRPAIYVTPEAAGNATILRHTVEHEKTHFRHGDNCWAILRGVCLALHWYNPLVWRAAFLSRNDSELACDEATIARIGENERAGYGRTLIGMTCLKRPALLITATAMTGSKSSIKERIMLIAKKPKMAIYTLAAVVLIAAAAVGCTFTGASSGGPWSWAQGLNMDEVSAVTPWYAGGDLAELSDDDAGALLSLLHGLKREDFTENTELTGGTPSYGLRIETVGGTYSINESIAPAGTLEMSYGDKQWWIDSGELSAYIIDKTAAAEDSMAISVDVGENVPGAVIDYATDYVRRIAANGNKITAAKITGLTQISTGTAGLASGQQLWLLEYRLLPEDADSVSLPGGMQMDSMDGQSWITEWGSTGQPYLLLHYEESGGETVWQRVCVTNTDVITQDYGTPEMQEKYGNAYTAAAMELYAEYLKRGEAAANPLDVIAAMKAVKAGDFTNPEYYGNVTADALARSLNAAADHRIGDADAVSAGYLEGTYPYWSIENAFLEGGPDSYPSTDLHFSISCGLAENIVEVYISKDNKRDTAYFEDETLYGLVRHHGDYDEIVDAAAYEKFKDILVPQMDETFAMMSANPGNFTDYQLTRFVLAWSYGNAAEGSSVELYDFGYALLTDDPTQVGWAGGMYLDSRLRVQGFNGGGQFAVKYRDGEIVCTTFMGNDFYYSPEHPGDADWARDRLNTALDWAESNAG